MLLVLFGCIFLFSAGKLLETFLQQHQEKKAFDSLAAQVEAVEYAAESQRSTAGQSAGSSDDRSVGNSAGNTENSISTNERPIMETDAETGILKPYLALYEQNQDLFGWLQVVGTDINYPVMCTPMEMQYYLRRSFDGTASKGGTPFLDTECTGEGNLYLIYGHCMKNKTMFGKLPYYAEEAYGKEHPLIYFDTLYEQGTYEVAAAFYSKIYAEEEAGFRYYEYNNLNDEQVFAEFKKGVEKSALYDTGVSLEYGDTVLMLSTCSYHTEDGRFVVVAVKKEK